MKKSTTDFSSMVQPLSISEMQKQNGGGVGLGMLAGLPVLLCTGGTILFAIGAVIGAGITGLIWYIKTKNKRIEI